MAWSTLAQFTTWGLPVHTVFDGGWESIKDHLDAAQSDIDDALRTAGYDLPIPLTSISPGIKRRECVIAGYHYLRTRGWEATSDADAEFVKEYERCLKWLEAVAKKELLPLPLNEYGEAEDAEPTTESTGVAIHSEPQRGWVV